MLIRVLVADDHAPTRAGVRASLDAAEFEVVAEASNARPPLTCAPRAAGRRLLDIHMPGGGIAAADEISRELPDCAVVMLTYSRDDDDLFDSLRAGARGYLLKDMDPDRLGPALHGVLAGEAALPRSLVSRVLEEFQGRSRRKLFVKDAAADPAHLQGVGGDGAAARGPVDRGGRGAAVRRTRHRARARVVGAEEASGARSGRRHQGARRGLMPQ